MCYPVGTSHPFTYSIFRKRVPMKINFEHSTGSTGDLFSEANPLKPLTQSATSSILRILPTLLIAVVFFSPKLPAQQTVGGITGEVTDSGA